MSFNSQSESHLINEARLHAETRAENNKQLAGQHTQIRSGKNTDILEPFAKAYLGLFLEIDNTFSPEQRIHFLVSDDLAEAIIEGLVNVLSSNRFPTPAEIGKKMADGERFEVGYIVLAGMDLLVKKYSESDKAFSLLDKQVLASALCFHYANSNDFRNIWVDAFFSYDRVLLSQTFQEFWAVQIKKDVSYLPGLGEQLKTRKGQERVGEIILPILSAWHGYKKKTLGVLLAIALRYADKNQLLTIVEKILETETNLNPRMRIVWMTTAFIIRPDGYWQQMQDYTYRSKEKLLPLLDFSVALLDEISLNVDVLTKIIRLVAPKFPPHIDDFGELAANPQKTLRLFYELGNRTELLTSQLDWLRSARVMKIVSPVLDEVERLNKIKHQHNSFPDFPAFISALLHGGKLKEKRSRFKNKL